jgi:hypothetical protein
MIYRHQARGADSAITSAINGHITAAHDDDQGDDDGTAGVPDSVG